MPDRGMHSGGKTATSQTLPRSANRIFLPFLVLCLRKDPQILGLCIIHDRRACITEEPLRHL